MASTPKPDRATKKPPDAELHDESVRNISRNPAPNPNRRIIRNVQKDVFAVTQCGRAV